jgi:hypothetical protein
MNLDPYKTAGVAGLGALLPFVPQLVALVHAPPALASAICAVVLAVAYKILPHDAVRVAPEAGK